ncbi:MAG: hypothetical protein GAK33_01954 [Burkholderia lata]|uniref:Uncharacterized protein n=1 Tax=Burkholderia lata (strain ATCC 17760 / DSM 23089 / LMG 22485 / NCIMB 9086 / R18194 / 383) TaxID=482957 RepID=A0A833PS73_BURL3|nr:MAG: hypothetical protein GAK33_01954 [Burkholderia lata]
MRFALFKRFRDGENVRYRAICWNPVDRQLHVLKLVAKGAPVGPGEWLVWSADAPDAPLKDIKRINENIVPDYMLRPLSKLPDDLKKALIGFAWRKQIVEAFCLLDIGGKGHPSDFVFNDQIVTSRDARLAAQNFVVSAQGWHRGRGSHLRKLFHQYCHFAGVPNAMLAQHIGKGKTGERLNLANKPGALTTQELEAKRKSEATGKPMKFRRQPVSAEDRAKFVDVLTRYWAKKRMSYSKTYDRLITEHCAGIDKHLHPTYDTFCRHANKLVPLHNLLALRNGTDIHEQYFAPRVGTATDYTQGKIEIVDVDGFTAKIGVRVKVSRRWKKIYLKVLFAVSRNSHAVLGVEIVLTGESAVAFRRCIASCYLDKTKLAKELGLDSADGLLHGNIDGVFVDNGAGPSEENIRVACGEMRISYEIAPPGRGEYKAVGENLNSLMVKYFEDEPSGYNRKNDLISKEKRRKSRRARGAPIYRFVAALYEAVRHHNLHAFRPHLRSHDDFLDGTEGSPMDIFISQQAQRRGDARRKWSEREILSRFIPWKRYKVQNGVVHFKKKLRYTSGALKALADKHAKIRPENRGPLFIYVKRFTADPHYLIWKNEYDDEELLTIHDEDVRRIQDTSWLELSLTQQADAELKRKSDSKSRAGRDKVTTNQHRLVAQAERARAASGNTDDLAGPSVSDAKALETMKHEREWGEREASALGFNKRETVPAGPKPQLRSNPTDDAFAARYRARKAASNQGLPEAPKR